VHRKIYDDHLFGRAYGNGVRSFDKLVDNVAGQIEERMEPSARTDPQAKRCGESLRPTLIALRRHMELG
jgi:hypothetical protein